MKHIVLLLVKVYAIVSLFALRVTLNSSTTRLLHWICRYLSFDKISDVLLIIVLRIIGYIFDTCHSVLEALFHLLSVSAVLNLICIVLLNVLVWALDLSLYDWVVSLVVPLGKYVFAFFLDTQENAKIEEEESSYLLYRSISPEHIFIIGILTFRQVGKAIEFFDRDGDTEQLTNIITTLVRRSVKFFTIPWICRYTFGQVLGLSPVVGTLCSYTYIGFWTCYALPLMFKIFTSVERQACSGSGSGSKKKDSDQAFFIDEEDECPICLDEMILSRSSSSTNVAYESNRDHVDALAEMGITVPMCGHGLHTKCYDLMRQQPNFKNECPICKTTLSFLDSVIECLFL